MPVPQENRVFVEQALLPRTGRMPVPQENRVFVERALLPRTGRMPVPQENRVFVEQAGKPVHQGLIENSTRSQFKPMVF